MTIETEFVFEESAPGSMNRRDNSGQPANHFAEVTVGLDFVQTAQDAAKVILVATAQLNNSVRLIERFHSHAGDALIIGTLGDIKTVAGDLSEAWADLDQILAAYDLGRD